MRQFLQCGRFGFDLDARPLVMGILNVTPDSFSDGGRFQSLEFAVSRAEEMVAEGVDMIDIGGESTRPGSPAVPLDEELRRVMPALYALRDLGKPLSVDTYKPEVMREAIIAGADMINDINGFRAPGAIEAVADSDCGLCIMHMQSTPQTMQQQPDYADVVREVIAFLRERVDAMAGGRHRRASASASTRASASARRSNTITPCCAASARMRAGTRPAGAGRPVAQIDDRRRDRQAGRAAHGRQPGRGIGCGRAWR